MQVGKLAWDSFHPKSEKNSSDTVCVCVLGQASGLIGLRLVCKQAQRAVRTASSHGLHEGNRVSFPSPFHRGFCRDHVCAVTLGNRGDIVTLSTNPVVSVIVLGTRWTSHNYYHFEETASLG